MAEEKKPEKPEGRPVDKTITSSRADPFVEVVSLIAVVFVVVSLVNGILREVNSNKILSRGWKGLTSEEILLSHTRPIAGVNNPIGIGIISVRDNSVYDSPAGKKIGGQKFGARGKILQGPVEEKGVMYWYVDYAKSPDGWVKENDIAYLESEPSILERVIIGIEFSIWWIKLFLILFSIACIAWMTYLITKLTKLRINERKLLYPKTLVSNEVLSPQWERILNHTESLNENDWRLAILEADIMLGGLLDRLYLPGETVADKLKAVEKSDFTTIDNAWEGHKIRNQIAHDGQAFIMTQREARRAIDLYRTVFEEFGII